MTLQKKQPPNAEAEAPAPKAAAARPERGADVFDGVVRMLAEIVLEDCRFQLQDFGPARPPLALQLMVLNVARLLLGKYAIDPAKLGATVRAVLPAFHTFPAPLFPRLLAFLHDDVLGALQGLAPGHIHGIVAAVATQTLECLSSMDAQDPNWVRLAAIVRRLLGLKPDLHFDLLRAIALRDGAVRRMAICLLREIWPDSVAQGRGRFAEVRTLKQAFAAFPLDAAAPPFGWETLSEALLLEVVAGCLSDADLAVTEFGLVVAQRASQGGVWSKYALQDLTSEIIAWILAEVRLSACACAFPWLRSAVSHEARDNKTTRHRRRLSVAGNTGAAARRPAHPGQRVFRACLRALRRPRGRQKRGGDHPHYHPLARRDGAGH
jgi:hypothetical protein